MKKLMAITLLVAFCGMSYELLIARTLSLLTGEIVLSQTWTVGFFILALGLGAYSYNWWQRRAGDEQTFFYQIEILLSFFGLIGVPALLIAHLLVHYYGLDISSRWFFVLLGQVVTVVIGYFSGFEIPILINRGSHQNLSESRVLGVHALGAMVGGLVSAFIFQRFLQPVTSGIVVAACNMLVAFLLVQRHRRELIKAVAFLAVFLFGGVFLPQIAVQHTKAIYFLTSPTFFAPTVTDLLREADENIHVERIFSHYQTIDLVTKRAFHIPEQNSAASAPQYEVFHRLYLNGQLQVSQGYEDVYHELFAHVPFALAGSAAPAAPKKILILGGGDGILAYQLTRRPEKPVVQLVELDPTMIHLARTHDFFTSMNHGVLSNDDVRVVVDDAFTFILRNHEKFDAIYADFPLPRDDELMRLFSTEFYSAVRRSLNSGGFFVADTPGSGTSPMEKRIVDSLFQAGFQYVDLYGAMTRFVFATDMQRHSGDPLVAMPFLSQRAQHYLGVVVPQHPGANGISLFRPGSHSE